MEDNNDTPSRKYRPLSTTVWDESSRFTGQTPSVTLTCGRERTNGLKRFDSPEKSIKYHQTWNPQGKEKHDAVNWSHFPETSIKSYQADSDIEPTWKKKKRSSKEH